MHKNYDLGKALVSEFIGTFTLVFVGCSAVALSSEQGGSLLVSALAFGLVFAAIVAVFAVYSGGHANPAISFAAALSGKMKWAAMFGYWVAQILAAIAAAALVLWFFGKDSGVGASIGSLTNTNAWAAVVLEAILTFFLVMVYLFSTMNLKYAGFAGIVTGFVLAVDMLAGSALTGASMNPARSLGPAIFSGNLNTYWIYVVGPLLGALVAGLVAIAFSADWKMPSKSPNMNDSSEKITEITIVEQKN